MNNQNLLIYESKPFYNIFNELKDSLSFDITYVSKKEFSELDLSRFNNYLILTSENLNVSNQLMFENSPIGFQKLLEKINIQFLKQKFNKQSNINIGNYIININSREMLLNNEKLKLTEKEVNTIIYLFKKNKSISIDELQQNVWLYHSELETHTVETHIHRLRKKIKEKFNDGNFIVSSKKGYLIN
tara:strand:- start:1462 stop:2022 length:561 start_codon:yes stop_codon:yes gene_type:complete